MPKALCIGIAGGTGSGKTTVARAIIDRVGRERISELAQDRYYRDLSHMPLSDRARRNLDIIPEGEFNTVALDLVISRIEGILDHASDETASDEVG